MNKEYLNPNLTAEERTSILLEQMTIEEKVGQMMQISYMKAEPVLVDGKAVEWISRRMDNAELNTLIIKQFAGSFLHVIGDEAREIQRIALTTRLGIPILFGIDAIHGHGLHNGSTIFPTQLAMACSWDKELVQKMGRATAKEVAADGLHWTFSPVLCIARDLRWGRVNETFGEDPYLIGEMGAAIIKGYQGESLSDESSILACAKHYIAYGESTGGRDAYDAEVSIRKVREVFLPPFAKAVEAGCATFMTSYQSIDGTPTTMSKKLLKNILKDELQFDGFVVTDWNNTGSLITQQRVAKDFAESVQMTLTSGNDMIMNTPDFYDAAVEQAKSGVITQKELDDAVRRILLIKFKLGLFEKARKELGFGDEVFACDEHQEVNLAITRKSVVLLENKNNILPLSKDIKRIAVIGPNADDLRAQYGDWTYFSHPQPKDNVVAEGPYVTVLDGVKRAAAKYGIAVNYNKGCHVMNREDQDIDGAVKLAKESDVVVAVVGDCINQNGEYKDRGDLDLSGAQLDLLGNLKATGKPLVVVLVNGKPLTISWVKENADAVLETFNAGMLTGTVVGEVLFGETNPTGKLPISFAHHVGQLPVYYNQLSGWHGSKYMDLPMEPLYAFGYGLSYSAYSYDNMRLSADSCQVDDEITVSVDVTNTSTIDGEEVVQLYVHDVVSSIMVPAKQLKGFERVAIKAGETKCVDIKLAIKELYIVTPEEHKVVEPGEFKIMIGPDSRDESLILKMLIVKG